MDFEQVIDKFRELGLFIQDLEGRRAYPNYMWREWGYTEEEMNEYGFLHYVHPEDREKVSRIVERFHSGEQQFSRVVFRIRDKRGDWHWILSSCLSVERDGQGKILQYVGFDHDITEEMEARARAEKALKEAETLISANKAITAQLDLPHTITAILEQAGRVLSFDTSSVQLFKSENGTGEMEIVGGIGFPEASDVIGTRFPLTGQTPNSVIVEELTSLVLSRKELASYSAFYDHSSDEVSCWMGVPLICKDVLLGMITFDRFEEIPFSEDDLRLALAFSGHVAIALDNSKLYEETKQLAITDPLTGCYTRRWMHRELEKLCEISLRNNNSLSLIMLDIDDFKFVNDTYGHLEGDKILIYIARLVGKVMRKYDLLCRVGGEEFIIILPQTPVESAMEVAERIKVLIADESAGSIMKNPVTVSLGCTQLKESDEGKIEDFISRADRAMYRSKRKGKNCVSFL